jgi:hypothetical protein
MIQCKTRGNEVALLGGRMGVGDQKNLDICTVRKAMIVQITVLARASLMCANTLQVSYICVHFCTKKTMLLLSDGISKNYFQ